MIANCIKPIAVGHYYIVCMHERVWVVVGGWGVGALDIAAPKGIKPPVTLGFQRGHLLFGITRWYEWRHACACLSVCVCVSGPVLWYGWQAGMNISGWWVIFILLPLSSLHISLSYFPRPFYLLCPPTPPVTLPFPLPLPRQQRGSGPGQYSSAQLCHFTRGSRGSHQPQVCLQGTFCFALKTLSGIHCHLLFGVCRFWNLFWPKETRRASIVL